MSNRQRKIYNPEFKVKVVMAALKGQQTISEIASEYEVHPNQVLDWKKQAMAGLPEIFSHRRASAAAEEESLKAELF